LCPEQKYRKSRKKAEPESPSNFYAISPPEAESIDAAQPTPVHPAEESQPYLLLPLHLELAVLEKRRTDILDQLAILSGGCPSRPHEEQAGIPQIQQQLHGQRDYYNTELEAKKPATDECKNETKATAARHL
jgi:hypothetical protein